MKVLELKSSRQTYVVTDLTDSEIEDMIAGIQDINRRLKEEHYFLKNSNYTYPIEFSQNPKISVYSTQDNLHFTKAEETDIKFNFCVYPKSTASVKEILDSLISNAA